MRILYDTRGFFGCLLCASATEAVTMATAAAAACTGEEGEGMQLVVSSSVVLYMVLRQIDDVDG